MDLKCELSPLVFSELYEMLAADPSLNVSLELRLADIDLDLDWLADAAVAYEAVWERLRADPSPATAYAPLHENHSRLATWVLAGLLRLPDWHVFSDQLAEKVSHRFWDEVAGTPSLPDAFRPVIRMWVLGAVVGDLSSTVPIIPARLPLDDVLREAYHGLVEHALLLGAYEASHPGEDWPELMCTAISVRGAGFADYLRPGDTLSASIQAVMADVRHFMSEEQHKAMTRHWVGGDRGRTFAHRRNVVSHLGIGEQGHIDFTEAARVIRSREEVETTLLGAATFICFAASEENIPGINRNSWRHLETDLRSNDKLA